MRFHYFGIGIFILTLAWMGLGLDLARGQSFTWTILLPENDSRDLDVRQCDELTSEQLVHTMNVTEQIFQHHLACNKIAIKKLLSVTTPFCELRFDAMKQLILTDEEKAILREYLERGGFLLLVEDLYPYPQDAFWSVQSWPVVDFITKELPVLNPDFQVEKFTDAHTIFHQYYHTKTSPSFRHELEGNPHTPSRTLLAYRQHPSVVILGRFHHLEHGKWTAETKPFGTSIDWESYKLLVNIYIYATLH